VPHVARLVALSVLKDREATRAKLTRELDALTVSVVPTDHAALRAQAMTMLDDWRGLLRGNTSQARQVLKRVLGTRLTFGGRAARGPGRVLVPRGRNGKPTRFGPHSACTSGGVPNGIRTRVSALKGPRPGPLDDGDARREVLILTPATRVQQPGVKPRHWSGSHEDEASRTKYQVPSTKYCIYQYKNIGFPNMSRTFGR
jgi:hypothetical protein